MVVETIAGGLGGLNAAIGMVKGLNTTITEAKVAEAKMEIIGLLINAQQGLLDAQHTLLEDTDTIRSLEAEVVKLKDWSAQAERYELADTGKGAMAYRLKEAEQDAEPPHWLCPNCFAESKKSFLIPDRLPTGHARVLHCNVCGIELLTEGHRVAEPAYRTRGGRR